MTSGFEEVETDLGEKIDWKEEKGFAGIYLGSTMVEAPDQVTGELSPVKVHLFKDGAGKQRFAWSTPRLDRGLQQAPERSEVVILYTGQEELSGGRRLNTFRVAVRSPAASELEA